jgi:hypothetical protein
MAMAEIGALRVTLSLNAGEFSRGLKKAGNDLDGFANRVGFAAAAGTAAANAISAAFRGISSGVLTGFSKAIDAVGGLVDASQKLGIVNDQLAGLKHAAEQSGLSFEQLGSGLGILSKNLAGIAGGAVSPAAQNLKALGISATDAAGQLKGVDAIVIELADKFAGMQDGAAKTALAMQLFGKSGADMIPMLNLGSAEIARLRQEANQLGLVLDAETAAGVEALGDSFATIGKAVSGFWTQLSGQLLPTLKFLTDRILEWLSTGEGVRGWAKMAGDGIKSVVDFGVQAVAMFSRLTENVSAAGTAFGSFFAGRWSEIAAGNAASAERLKAIETQLTTDLAAIWTSRVATETAAETARIAGPVAMRIAANKQLTEGEAELNRLIDEGTRVMEAHLTPYEAMIAAQEKLNILQAQGAITATTYGRAMAQASAFSAKNMDALASNVSSNLSAIFGESKGVAIATAIINTAQGVTRALAQYPPPISFAMAALQAAAGAAQIAKIKSMTKSGGGGGGGDGGASAAASASTAAGGSSAGVQQSLTVQGIDPGQMFSGEVVRGLAERLLKYQADGGKVVLA